jgi:carbon monoxide dehydrogenase subunit G
MTQMSTSRKIAAPPERVFDTVAHIENFSKAIPGIINVEFLTDQRVGVGTRFRETRLMKGREASTELEVTEYEPHERIRLVADEGGTVWDTVFEVSAVGDGSTVSMVMDARPHTRFAKVTTPLMKRMIAKVVEGDMDAVKEYCEAVS